MVSEAKWGGGRGAGMGCCCGKKRRAEEPAAVAEAAEAATERTQEDSRPGTETTASMAVSAGTERTPLTRSTLYSEAEGRKRRRTELLSSYENLAEIKDALAEEEQSLHSWRESFAKKGEDSARSDYCLHREAHRRLFKTEVDATQVPSVYRPAGGKDDKSASLLEKGHPAPALGKPKPTAALDDEPA